MTTTPQCCAILHTCINLCSIHTREGLIDRGYVVYGEEHETSKNSNILTIALCCIRMDAVFSIFWAWFLHFAIYIAAGYMPSRRLTAAR